MKLDAALDETLGDFPHLFGPFVDAFTASPPRDEPSRNERRASWDLPPARVASAPSGGVIPHWAGVVCHQNMDTEVIAKLVPVPVADSIWIIKQRREIGKCVPAFRCIAAKCAAAKRVPHPSLSRRIQAGHQGIVPNRDILNRRAGQSQ